MSATSFMDRAVIVTGASSGIGRELALQLAERGAFLSLAARDAARLERVRLECESRGGKAMAVSTDVTLPSQCAELVRLTSERYGRIDVLVNNAGISMWSLFEDVTDLGLFETIMAVNYLGAVYCTHYSLPHLKKTKGLLVGVSSLTGKTGVPTRSGYAASKHAMAGFFDSLRIELAPHGVDVTMIYPGFVATGIRERVLGADGRPLGKSPLQEEDMMPVERCAERILRAMAQRRRELVMTRKGRLGLWMKLIAPELVDRTARRAIETGRT